MVGLIDNVRTDVKVGFDDTQLSQFERITGFDGSPFRLIGRTAAKKSTGIISERLKKYYYDMFDSYQHPYETGNMRNKFKIINYGSYNTVDNVAISPTGEHHPPILDHGDKYPPKPFVYDAYLMALDESRGIIEGLLR